MTRPRRTTYILGAGASKHAGYPFISTMGIGLLQWMRSFNSQPDSIYPETAAWLNNRFGENIEAIFNGLDGMIRRGGVDRAISANVHKPALVQAMREWFDHIHRSNSAHAYGEFASRIVQPGDRVVSFNYDVSLDAKLRESGKWDVGDGYGFAAEGFPRGSTGKLLKLHGSINWWAVLFGGRVSELFVVISWRDRLPSSIDPLRSGITRIFRIDRSALSIKHTGDGPAYDFSNESQTVLLCNEPRTRVERLLGSTLESGSQVGA